MIEFLLIFALGFLAAAILGMLVTPAIHGRIVKLTEKRIEATVPLSHAEIKGKADLMRAGFASETAKLTAQLEKERDQKTRNSVRADKLQSDLAHVVGEKKLVEQQIEDLTVQAGEMRSSDRKKQQLVEELTDTVRQYERIKNHDDMELARLHNDLVSISTEVESMRIDLAANGAEAENLRSQVDSLNRQREQLHSDIDTLKESAKEMEETLHAEQESHNQNRIELATTQTALEDRESRLKTAFDQIDQQKTQLEEQMVAHQNDREKLLADIEGAVTTAAEIQKNLEKEREQHEATRNELAGLQASLAEREAELVRTREETEEQKRQLGIEIESLNLDRSRLEREIEVAAQNAKALEDRIDAEQEDHRGTRVELAARQSLLEDRIRQIAVANDRIEAQRQQLEKADEANLQTLQQLKDAQEHGALLAGRVENTKTQLDKSRAAERASREKLAALRAESKQLQQQLETPPQRPVAREDQDAASAINGRPVSAAPIKTRQRKGKNGKAGARAKQRESDLESQIDTLRNELQQSHATSAQYHEQLLKMRNEINKLHRHEALAQSNGIDLGHPPLPETEKRNVNGAVRGRMEDLRQRHVALVDTLKNASDDSADHRMREELANIAAAVVGLSGRREGEASPIHKIISKEASGNLPKAERVSLASRAKSELEN